MSLIDTLREVEADIAALGGLSGEIRAKVKDGVAELTKIRDDITSMLAAVTGSARAALASLEAMAASAAGGVGLDSAGPTAAEVDPSQPPRPRA